MSDKFLTWLDAVACEGSIQWLNRSVRTLCLEHSTAVGLLDRLRDTTAVVAWKDY